LALSLLYPYRGDTRSEPGAERVYRVLIMARTGINLKSIVISLIVINVIVFFFTEVIPIPVPGGLLNNLISKGSGTLALVFKRYGLFITIFSLFPALIWQLGWVWQVFTYMFLHGSFLHLFFNMYALLLFGRSLEDRWGKNEFLMFYIFTGVGAGIITFCWNLFKNPYIPTIGASGAIFGVMLAFGLEFPDTLLLLFFLIPIRAKYAALLFGGIELVMIVTGSMQGIGHFTHLAGLLFGYVYYLWRIKNRYKSRRKSLKQKLYEISVHRSNLLSEHKKEMAVHQAELIRDKLRNGESLSRSEENFLLKLREAYNRYNSEMCEPDEFSPSAADCLKCDSLYACLYRYVLEIK